MEDLERSLQESALEYYQELTPTDPEELINDALTISTNQLNRLQKALIDNKSLYKALKLHKTVLKRELEIVDKEKIEALQNYASDSFAFQLPLSSEIQSLENAIIKFRLLKAELEQKLENLEDLSQHWKTELIKKKNMIVGLKKDLERYSEYRNSIQKVICKHQSSGSRSTASNNSSFSVQNTPGASLVFSDRSTARVSYRSAHGSLFFE